MSSELFDILIDTDQSQIDEAIIQFESIKEGIPETMEEVNMVINSIRMMQVAVQVLQNKVAKHVQ